MFIERQEEKQKPQVVFDSGQIIKMAPSEIQGIKESEAVFVFSIYTDDKDKASSFQWHAKKLDFNVIADNILKILDKSENELISADLTNFDYIGRIYAQQFALDNSGTKGMAVLVRLRATSRRSMLLIYNPSANLLYQELLARRGDSEMSVMTDSSGKEYLYVNVEKPTIYSSKIK